MTVSQSVHVWLTHKSETIVVPNATISAQGDFVLLLDSDGNTIAAFPSRNIECVLNDDVNTRYDGLAGTPAD